MCGIAGGFNVSRETVFDMLERQSSRGPDFTGIEQIGNIIFGHNRLSIIDKSERSNQPIKLDRISGDFDKMLSYNGEIYNYNSSGAINCTSDTLSLLSDLNWTPEIPIENILNNQNGMFAFAYFDGEQIYLVRDRFGIKPIYYTHQKDFFAFASTPAAVALTKDKWELSQKGLQEYLSLGATMLHSMFEGIVAVPPGHYVTFNCKTNEVTVKRWYYPKFIENAIQTIEEKVTQAIDRVKLTCDWPQIILLSGGIDSTLVASRYAGQNAIHLSSPEQEYAQRVADRFGIKLNNVHPANFSVEECLTDYVFKCGDPTMAGFIPYITCKEIAKLGFRVAITANGADELFFGYDRMKDMKEQDSAIFRNFEFQKAIYGDIVYRFAPKWVTENNGIVTINELNWAQVIEIWSYLSFDLNKTLDFASMCHSVEVRVPYLDHELVEAALSMPMDKHVAKYGNKTLLKNMLVKLGFDWDFIHRGKVGFSLHSEPYDLQEMKQTAMKWYKNAELPVLPENSTGRQQAYHEMTVLGLYFWNLTYKLIN